MFDGVGEVFESAVRDGLLGRILRGRIRFRHEWNNHLEVNFDTQNLDVSFGSKGTRFEQRLVVEDTAPINVFS